MSNRTRTQGKEGQEDATALKQEGRSKFRTYTGYAGGGRTQLRGLASIQKRYYLITAADNPDVFARSLCQKGPARGLQCGHESFFTIFTGLQICRILSKPPSRNSFVSQTPKEAFFAIFNQVNKKLMQHKSWLYKTDC